MKSLNIEMIKLVISFIKKEVTGNELYIKVWSFILNRERDFIDEINIEEFEEFEELKKIIERK
ncbi:MAG: hypothetical protein P1U46_03070 [Patescibacteria group bacterium]|nr:hypothetical protein [Patescibacteria group bacterium]